MDFAAPLCSDGGMKVTGKITRLVQGSRKDRSDDRVFILPNDPGVLRKLDGSQYLASGEIASTESIEGLEVGTDHEIEAGEG